jgi:hypothetical protein
MAWQQTRGRKGLIRENPPSDDLTWGSTALAGATSWVRVEPNGLGTLVHNVTGTKYWVLLNRRRETPRDNYCGNMASMDAFPDDWEPCSAGCDAFQHEGILLTPGSLLYVHLRTLI